MNFAKKMENPPHASSEATAKFCQTSSMEVVAVCPTPLFSAWDKKTLEMIAFPGTLFQVIDRKGSMVKVKTEEYPFPGYVDAHCVVEGYARRARSLPPVSHILATMESRVGLPYVWGGNFVTPEFAGLDCSGLLYEATLGFVPRNTRELYSFGIEVDGKHKPLDIFVYNQGENGWDGHVIIALDEERGIESARSFGGVTICPLQERLASIPFPITHRRWHEAFLQKS